MRWTNKNNVYRHCFTSTTIILTYNNKKDPVLPLYTVYKLKSANVTTIAATKLSAAASYAS